MTYDPGLERELGELGIRRPGKPMMLPGEESRDLGAVCIDCGSPRVEYLTTASAKPPLPPPGRQSALFRKGAYCYRHLVAECRRTYMIPFPIEQGLLDRLKDELGLDRNRAATWNLFGRGER